MEPVKYAPEPQAEQEASVRKSSWQKPIAQSFLFLANGVALGLVFGQLLTTAGRLQINWWVFLIGVVSTVALYISAIKLFKKA